MIETFKSVIQQLEAARFDYMVVGSVASTVYGEPRLTMDMVVELPAASAGLILNLFPPPVF